MDTASSTAATRLPKQQQHQSCERTQEQQTISFKPITFDTSQEVFIWLCPALQLFCKVFLDGVQHLVTLRMLRYPELKGSIAKVPQVCGKLLPVWSVALRGQTEGVLKQRFKMLV